MSQRLSARQQLQRQALTPKRIRRPMQRIYPRKNDYVTDMSLFAELIPELARFGITRLGQLQRLVKKHRRALFADDRSRLSAIEIKYYSEWFGTEHTLDGVRCQYWFAYPAFVRNALESEFGEAAQVWAEGEPAEG